MKTTLIKFVVSLMLIILLSSCVVAYQVPPTPTVTPAPTPTSTPTPPYRMLSSEDMRSDLDEIFRQIEKYQPDQCMHRSKADVERDREVLYEQLGQPMTIVDYYKKVAPLVSSLGDDHTEVDLPNETYDQIYSYGRFLPLQIVVKRGKAFIVGNYTGNPDIPLGAELLAINNLPISEIQSRLIPDPFMSFFWKYWFFNGSLPEYQIELLPAGESTPVKLTIPGLHLNEMKSQAVEQPWEEVSYKTLPGEKIGILTVNDFRSIYNPVKEAFSQIQADGVQDLIIDVRNNSGGFFQSLDLFMNYLTDQPYQRCYKCAFTHPWENVPNRYHGKIYLLIGPYTVSSGVTLSTVLQDHKLATLIGEETSEASFYCYGMGIVGGPLPKTGLKFRVSHHPFIRPSGIVDRHGVVPDIHVETTIDDMITGNDPVLNYTLDLIRNGGQMP